MSSTTQSVATPTPARSVASAMSKWSEATGAHTTGTPWAAAVNKSNEILAAVGLLALDGLTEEIRSRGEHLDAYVDRLSPSACVSFPAVREGTTPNHSYCCVRLRGPGGEPLARPVDDFLPRHGIESRRYFAGRFTVAPQGHASPYADALRADLLCLPLWGTMRAETLERVCDLVLRGVAEAVRSSAGAASAAGVSPD